MSRRVLVGTTSRSAKSSFDRVPNPTLLPFFYFLLSLRPFLLSLPSFPAPSFLLVYAYIQSIINPTFIIVYVINTISHILSFPSHPTSSSPLIHISTTFHPTRFPCFLSRTYSLGLRLGSARMRSHCTL